MENTQEYQDYRSYAHGIRPGDRSNPDYYNPPSDPDAYNAASTGLYDKARKFLGISPDLPAPPSLDSLLKTSDSTFTGPPGLAGSGGQTGDVFGGDLEPITPPFGISSGYQNGGSKTGTGIGAGIFAGLAGVDQPDFSKIKTPSANQQSYLGALTGNVANKSDSLNLGDLSDKITQALKDGSSQDVQSLSQAVQQGVSAALNGMF